MYTRYRIALAALALLALGTAPPASAAHAAEAAPDPARFAPGSTAPLTLADFSGGWWHHGFGLGFNPDGSADASWRVYRWCKDTGGKQPCDGMDGNTIVNGGQATIRASRVEGRTLYGTVLTTTDADTLARGPFTLTEYDYGIGELTDARALGAAAIGASEDARRIQRFCGPRSGDAPDWFTRIMPCGA
jgi:hypothetical protein